MTTTQKTAIKFLFISFSGLLCALKSGKVSAEDLAHGLFCFGRTRAQAFNPTDEGAYQLKALAYEYAREAMKQPETHPKSIEEVLKELGKMKEPSAAQREQGWEKASVLHRQVVDAVLLAEKEGRVQWLIEGGRSSFKDLNLFLEAHGLPLVKPGDSSEYYSYPAIEEAFEGSGTQVVWRA